MPITKLGRLFTLSSCLTLAMAIPAYADCLLGSTISWQYYAFGGPYSGGTNSGTFVVTGGVGGTFSDNRDLFNIIVDDTSMTFDYSVLGPTVIDTWSASSLSLAPTIHNGIAINMVSELTFSSVTIDPRTNMIGFNASRVSFTDKQIQVDWQNLPFNERTIVKLDIDAVPTAAIPEPATMLLLGTGLAGIGGIIRKRRQVKAE